MTEKQEKTTQVASETKVFTFNPSNQPIRVETIGGEPWFVAKDVCDALTITNNRDAVAQLDDDEKLMSVIPTSGQGRQMWLVNESGLYNLIFQSRKPEAKAFRKWVTAEVLPTIRKTGRYELRKPKAQHRRITRGEGMTVELMELLWLIGECLERGDQRAIALELGVTVQTVNRTLNGQNRSAKVLMALYQRARANHERTMLYTQPALMAERLMDGGALPCGPQLPPVHIEGKRGLLGCQNASKRGQRGQAVTFVPTTQGGQRGNQNARKQKEGGAL